YNSGQTYSLEITVGADLNGKGGFNLAASSGTLSTSDPNTKIVGGEAVHSNSNSRTWIVDWMAPPQGTGTVSFTLAALVADGNGQKTNDGWDTLSIDVPEANLPPVISNIQIMPANPTSSDSLQLSYDYEDDNNEVDSSSISWFKNGVLDSQGTISNSADILFIDYSKTERDDVWSVQIMPNDGENSGTIVNAEVVILNSKPLASNLSIMPSGPSQNDDLTASWDEFDEDGDVLTNAIKWYNNGTHQTELDGVTTVSSSFTKENEEWFFSIILNDSFEENIQNSTKVTLNLINDIPTLENLQIENINPTTDLSLSATWDFLDGDGDEQINFETKWYLNDVHQSELDDLLVIDSQYTSKGDLWFFQARASDGIEFSEWYQSINVEINNSIPEVVANIYPNNPTNGTDLQLNISTIDLDDDLLTIEIEWVKNNSTITTNYSEITPNKI
ncbi:MAG: choice-of-anchor V domain-containing protein, partial [Candidatus Thermoplasmatota archaeon]|nr:choice-of-anchor V domain-containing protein [Candidatus Thermoplasmatota archaeon]